MPSDNPSKPTERGRDDSTRRASLATGTLAASAGLTATGTATAQDGGDEGDADDVQNGTRFRVATFQNAFHNQAEFLLVSRPIDYSPDVPADVGGNLTGYDTYVAAYLNTGERFLLFVSQTANLGATYDEDEGWFVTGQTEGDGFNAPALYQLSNQYNRYEGTDRLVTAYAFSVEVGAQNYTFAQEGLNDEEEINDLLF
ncbi:hypothetical protein [Natrinema sp. 74]|uniref:hypothetical protein n=1 Tax=Natrinema sp. 74 TaxID=3384159 RepID=UPI0038D476F9